jgi:SAM-dependent methyltransferase
MKNRTMRLGTTTWPFRGTEFIGAIMQQALEDRQSNPLVVDIGPGGMSGIGRWLHPVGRSEAWNGKERVCRGLGRFADNFARSLPYVRVSSPEIETVYLASIALKPRKLVFVDLEERVLDAGRRLARLLQQEQLFDFRQMNVVNAEIGVSADIVIAHTVLGRVSDRAAGLKHICAAVRPGGLLSLNDEKELPGFTRLSKAVFRKHNPGG